MIIFSDLHLREDSEDVVFDEVLPGIRKAAMSDPEKLVAFLGDWWHIRYTVSVRLFNRVRDELAYWSKLGIRVFILPGNHDQIDFEGRNALEAFDDIENVDVFTVPAQNAWGLWIPYRKDHAQILSAIEAYEADPEKLAPRILWIHHGINGAMMNDFHRNTEGLSPEEFKGFEHVFCGHYHKRQVIQHIAYIGSPWQTTFAEAGQDKGYVTWYDGKFEYVNTLWGKRYHRVELGPGDSLDLSQVRSCDEVRVTTKPGVDPAVIGKELMAANIAGVVTPQVEELQTRLDVAPDSGMEVYAEAYVEAVDTDLNRGRLMEVYRNIVGGAP